MNFTVIENRARFVIFELGLFRAALSTMVEMISGLSMDRVTKNSSYVKPSKSGWWKIDHYTSSSRLMKSCLLNSFYRRRFIDRKMVFVLLRMIYSTSNSGHK